MKKLINNTITLAFCASLILASCGTTPKAQEDIEPVPEVTEKVKKEPKPITVQNTSNQLEKDFKAMLSNLELKVKSTPNPKKTVYTDQAFLLPYEVSCTDQNGPVANLDVTVSWPFSRNNDTISYNTVQLKSNEEGIVSFLPPNSSIAVKDKITFYPTPVSSSSTIVQAAYNAGVEAPFVVKSKYTQWPGGIIFVYDYNENGRAGTNNFELLQNLRNSGINAGNAPVSDSKYLDRPLTELCKECRDIVGNQAAFLVAGSIKYAEPASEADGKVTVTLTADLTCFSMKTGAVLYKTSITDSATDVNKWSADKNCRSIIAAKAADAIVYGM